MTDIVERLRGGVYGINRIALCQEAANELESVRAKLDALRADAERYRWLTEGKRGDWVWNHVLTDDQQNLGNNINEVIDAALKGE